MIKYFVLILMELALSYSKHDFTPVVLAAIWFSSYTAHNALSKYKLYPVISAMLKNSLSLFNYSHKHISSNDKTENKS